MELQKDEFKPNKDMKTVADYNKKKQLEMFRFSCFNNASALLVSSSDVLDITQIFDLAEKLYAEGVKRDYLMLEKGGGKNEGVID